MFQRPHSLRPRLFVAVLFAAAATACDASSTTRPGADRPSALATAMGEPSREVDLGSCTNLAVTAPHRVSTRLYATGTQNYSWDGNAWIFTGPEAELFSTARSRGTVGFHYAGPTWVSRSGSGVVGAVAVRCTPDAGAIPWLLLTATSSHGPGIFDGTTLIQRIHTTGGLIPSAPGTAIGEVARVPYTAEYVFYR